MPDLKDAAYALEDYIISIRRELHRIPEISWQEHKTIKVIKREITSIISSSPWKMSLHEKMGGLVVDVDFNPNYKRLLFRADIDGLPIEEKISSPYKSIHPGKMHACGHDVHTAMLLGALKAISRQGTPPPHNLRFVWQRAEEMAVEKSGGTTLIEEGVCEGIDSVYGLHVSSHSKPGLFLSRPGPFLANSAQFSLEIESMGGHVMNPEQGSNSIDILTDIHVMMRHMAARILGPRENIALVPALSQAGNCFNVMPSNAKLYYSFRNYLSTSKREMFLQEIEKSVRSVISGYKNARLVSFQSFCGFPPLVNDPENHDKVQSLLYQNDYKTELHHLVFAGEDFAYFLKEKPGSYWILGTQKDGGADHHTAYFDPEESVFYKGTAFWLHLAYAKELTSHEKPKASMALAEL